MVIENVGVFNFWYLWFPTNSTINSEKYFFLFDSEKSESLSGALDGCYSYDGEQNQWNLYTTLKKPRYRFSHVMINKDTMWLTGKYFG